MELDFSEFPNLGGLPVALTYARDIEAADGPLLVLYVDRAGRPYLYYWCDGDDAAQRWLVFRSTWVEVIGYRFKRWDLLTLLRKCPDGTVFVCDFGPRGLPLAVRVVPISQIPEVYLPVAGALYGG